MVRPVMMQLQGVSFLPAATTASTINGGFIFNEVGGVALPSLYSRNINGYQVSIFPADQLGHNSLTQLFGSGPVTVDRTNALNRALFLNPGRSEPDDYSPTSNAGILGAGVVAVLFGGAARVLPGEIGGLFRRLGPGVDYPAPNLFERAHFEAVVEALLRDEFPTAENRRGLAVTLSAAKSAFRRVETFSSPRARFIERFENYLLAANPEPQNLSSLLNEILSHYGSLEAAQADFRARNAAIEVEGRRFTREGNSTRVRELEIESRFFEIMLTALNQYQNQRIFFVAEARTRLGNILTQRLADRNGIVLDGGAQTATVSALQRARSELATTPAGVSLTPVRAARLALVQEGVSLRGEIENVAHGNHPNTAPLLDSMIHTLETQTRAAGESTPEALLERMLADLESQETALRVANNFRGDIATAITAERNLLQGLQQSLRDFCQMPAVTATSAS